MNTGADRLPGEVLEEIFSYLPCEDLVESVQFVCTWWQQVSWEKALWKHVMYKPRLDENVRQMLQKTPQLRIMNLRSTFNYNNVIQLINNSCPNLEHLHIRWESIYNKSDFTRTRPLSQIKILSLFTKASYRKLDFRYLHSAFPNLESLNIAELRFDRKDVKQYLKKKRNSLHTLSISCYTVDEHCVLPCLSMCKKLRNLSLYNLCNIVRSGKNGGKLPNISRLTLYHSRMSNMNDSLPVFCSFPNITTLVLDCCYASVIFFCTIARICPRLQKLKLNSYGAFSKDDGVLIKDTLHALHLERLTHLCIHKSSYLTDECIEHVLRLMPQLIHLDLFQCRQVTTGCLKLICGIRKLEVLKFDLLNQPLPADLRASDVKNKNLQLMFYNCPDVTYLDALRQQHLRVCYTRHIRCWMKYGFNPYMKESSWIKHCCFWCS